MKKTIKKGILFSIPLILGIGILFLVPLDKEFSYKFVKGECDDKATWIYHRIYQSNKPIDIVFSGASQTTCTIMEQQIEEQLNTCSKQNYNVANLGYCRGGRDIQFVMLKALFEKKNPKILVLEVREDEYKKSHPVFPYLAESEDLWNSFVFFNQRFPQALWKGIIVRFEYIKHLLFGPETNNQLAHDDYGYRASEQKADLALMEENKQAWEKRLEKSKSPILRSAELNYPTHYLEKILRLAKENECMVLFLYLRESGSGLKKPMLGEFYKQKADLILLPEFLFTEEENWKDATHFNDTGALIASKYIAQSLCELLF